jgi:hypothetical protein
VQQGLRCGKIHSAIALTDSSGSFSRPADIPPFFQ